MFVWSEISLLSATHHASCVCLMERERQAFTHMPPIFYHCLSPGLSLSLCFSRLNVCPSRLLVSSVKTFSVTISYSCFRFIFIVHFPGRSLKPSYRMCIFCIYFILCFTFLLSYIILPENIFHPFSEMDAWLYFKPNQQKASHFQIRGSIYWLLFRFLYHTIT